MFDGIFEAIEEWMRELLTGMIQSNLSTMFTDVNEKTGEIAAQVGPNPARVEQQHIWDDTRIVGIGHRPHSRNDYHICTML